MIKLPFRDISGKALDYLGEKQRDVNAKSLFQEKVKKAVSLWDNKKKTKDGKLVFEEITRILSEMCPGVEICPYCEQNEATDIEHIFPKKHYPEKAFAWGNYLLACRSCNTDYKASNFKIFNSYQSADWQELTSSNPLPPQNDDALFINQRDEDPLEYLELDLVNRLFIFTEKHPPGTREYERASYTKELLELNKRATLVEGRKQAAKFYIGRLEKYVAAKNATSLSELENAIGSDIEWDQINRQDLFQAQQANILQNIKHSILTYAHPTVWKEMLRQSKHLPKTNQFIQQVPEVLMW
jgi:hypothetical protein